MFFTVSAKQSGPAERPPAPASRRPGGRVVSKRRGRQGPGERCHVVLAGFQLLQELLVSPFGVLEELVLVLRQLLPPLDLNPQSQQFTTPRVYSDLSAATSGAVDGVLSTVDI